MRLLNGYWRSEKMEYFIDENIIYPLHHAMHDGIYFNRKNLQFALECCRQEDRMDIFHEKMRPYYRKFLMIDSDMSQNVACDDVRYFILKAIPEDELFVEWFTENFHLWDVVHAWAEYYRKQKSESKEFMNLLLCLLSEGYECDWDSHVNELRHILLREEIKGNQYSRAVYCMFHGFVMLGRTTLPWQEKIALYSQFCSHWFVLRFLYSAMFRCIIGCGFTNFVQIPNQMKSRVDYHPYLHLFYATAMEQKEVICNRGAKRDKLEASLEEIRVLASKEPSDELNELCSILFPKVWKNYIEKHRLKDYKELEEELQRITAQVRTLAEQLSSMISVDVIAQKLLDLPPQTARAVFLELNAMLMGNEAWVKIQADLYNRILARTKAPEVKIEHADQVIAVAENNANVIHTKIDKK